MDKTRALRYRIAPLEMTPSEFRKAGYRLIDQVAELLYQRIPLIYLLNRESST
ncbi:MAG TPA: hypothetical protein VKR83_03280 [Ktedonobacteraceae bacterium]|nr:hypothetical protein [Ktedonobacteraceae bacterium]